MTREELIRAIDMDTLNEAVARLERIAVTGGSLRRKHANALLQALTVFQLDLKERVGGDDRPHGVKEKKEMN
jgi:hypothetical protein